MADQVLFDNYLNIRSAYSPVFDPNGGRIAFLTDITGVPQVWSVSTSGGWPDQLTFFDDRVSELCWDPSGKYLLFTMDTNGDERHQLYLIDPDSPAEIVRIDHDTDVMHIFGGWSPDGKSVTYAGNQRDRAFLDVYVHDVPDGNARLVYQQDGWNTPLGWSPDGRYLIISHARTQIYNDLVLLDVRTGGSRQLTSRYDAAKYASVEWSTDSSGFYLATNRDRQFCALARMDAATGEMTYVAEPDWDVQALSLSHDGSRVAYVVNEDGYSSAFILDLNSGAGRRIGGLPRGTLMNPRGTESVCWSPDDDKLAFTVNTPRDNPDVWLYDVNTDTSSRITFSATGGVLRNSFVEPKLEHFTTFDGRRIPVLVYTPKSKEAGETFPVIVSVHGGPEGQERPQFTANYQYFVRRGYCVVAPNVRGSTGYGREYTHLDDVRKRMDSVRDLKHLREWLTESEWADPDRVAVMGQSYGGFMVLSAITTYPDIWTAAVELYGISNFHTFFQNTSSYRRKLRAGEYGDPDLDAEFLREISPIHHIDEVRVPLFVLHGAMDPRVPIGETEQLVDSIIESGGYVEYLRFEDEGHGIIKKQNKLRAFPAIARFLDNHLMNS